MGERGNAKGANLVKQGMKPGRHVKYQTRASRTRRQALIKAGVWAFLVLFVISIAGVALVMSTVKQ